MPAANIWIELGDAGVGPALSDLWDALDSDFGPCEFSVTGVPVATDAVRGISPCELQGGDPRSVQRFMNEKSPDLFFICGGPVPQALLGDVTAAKLPSVFLATTEPIFQSSLLTVPGRRGRSLGRFDRLMAVSDHLKAAIQKAGAHANEIEVVGSFQPSPRPLGCDEAERNDLAAQLEGRPAWLSVATTAAEANLLADAHRTASARSHRLLLIVAPSGPDQVETIAQTFAERGLPVLRHSELTAIRPEAQVVLADEPSALGLWYRLAPVTFMASSLSGNRGRSPMEPASLGSAIIHGKNTGGFALEYQKLAHSRATCIVDRPGALAGAIESLIVPSRAAALAQAAWAVATEGAPGVSRVAEAIAEALN